MQEKILLLMGNEAIARGAYEAGVKLASAYPGTPSTEVLETLANFKDKEIWCEWAPNEKVALEVAAGASLAGARSLVAMKHVGLNVAADPLMTLSYIGVEGGLVIVVADDPGMHSSQNEQDTRNYAKFAKVPLLEPSDSQEAKDFTVFAFELSEKFKTPVILRSTTRISHCKSPVRIGERKKPSSSPHFNKNPERYVPVPRYGREMRKRLEERLQKLKEYSNLCPLNKIIKRENKLGIITASISFQYSMEEFPYASILKLGLSYPFPDRLIMDFSSRCEKVIIMEELDGFIEEHVKSLGIKAEGKKYFGSIGELTPDKVAEAHRKIKGEKSFKSEDQAQDEGKTSCKEKTSLPARPPVFCPGCPHRGLFYALSKIDCIVTGDIGCYSLGVFPPYSRMDTILCMGGGITVAHGMDKAGLREKPLIGVVGDSTFFHSGITGLLEISYNKGISTIIVVDNRITAMTGHQDHPGTGKTLMGEETYTALPEDFARACGIKNIKIIDPLDFKNTLKVLKEETGKNEPSFIVSRRTCALLERKKAKIPFYVDYELCANCGVCIDTGCPAIYRMDEKICIDEILCQGCGFCVQICPKKAIKKSIEK
ncbi:indolepyruvate ferredoxin oxidoreductase subunit alpha [Candidatus Aerophobetes bacterium]|nr:indolepyruvate ferredoxin oxidoreductase subunit alpha [Candidatus Aerophobetes bacterium]